MDAIRFDALTRALGHAVSRRASIPLLGSVFAFLPPGVDLADAKKKKKKKTTFCLDGQTIQASKKKKKKLLKSGATPGACSPPPTSPPPPSPPPPPGCTPTCSGTTCGGEDGCGGICACAADAICREGACQPCSVPCAGNSVECGEALAAALIGGGTIYLCPGRYTGSYTLGGHATLIGAGKGNDPAVDTILDANETGRVLDIATGATAALSGLRITGGAAPGDFGGGILNEGILTIDDCAIADNLAEFGGGIAHTSDATGPLTISNSTVADNTARLGGGFDLFNSAQAVTITTCLISGNKSTVGGGAGGGIHNFGNPVFILGSTITDNSAVGFGGGIYNETATATVTFDSASSVTGNTAPNGNGGGIYNDGGTVTLSGADVIGNTGGNCAPPGSVAGCVG